MMDFKEYGIDVGLLISGLFGSILLTSKDSSRNVARTISSIIGGAASANYIAPVLISFTKINDSHYQYGVAFLLGFLGLKGIEFFSTKVLPDEQDIEQVHHAKRNQLKPRRKRTPHK